MNLSNTYLLEKNFGWTGMLGEPAKVWHDDLKNNRSAHIETRCIWSSSGEVLNFNEASVGEFSTIDNFSEEDSHWHRRKSGSKYEVETISFNDFLTENNAPQIMDYLSIDTEGSEFEILNSLDFSKFKFRVITCEHNYTEMRERIYNLLSKNGYVRKYEDISRWDDWYVLKEDL